ncbi:MAG: hypothetical protein IJS14_11260 [Lentisphaeria bacterium]|nr:hypothetical protein [Lentisphaeria bacterium]
MADRLESLFDSMLFFWFVIPLFVGLLEQISGGTPVRFSELFAPVLTTPFLLWHRLGFLFSEYCFRPAPAARPEMSSAS